MADAVERRAWPRVSIATASALAPGRLRPGKLAHIVDVSAGGALIETVYRLLPGSRVELQLGDPVVLHTVKGKILRSHVSMLARERIRYRGAVVFEQQIPLSGE